MKKILILSLLLLVVAIGANAQKYYYNFTTDTVSSNSSLYYPSTNGFKAVRHSVGVLTFTFTHTDLQDSLNYARWEYKDGSGTWTALTGDAALANTSTDGQSTIYKSTPIIHEYYRVVLNCATGDSVKITVPTLMYKEE